MKWMYDEYEFENRVNNLAWKEEKIMLILKNEFKEADEDKLSQFAGIFLDLQLKFKNGEISSKSIDLRGLIGALKTIKRGLDPYNAINIGITSKSFDSYEKEIIGDIIRTRIASKWNTDDIFPMNKVGVF